MSNLNGLDHKLFFAKQIEAKATAERREIEAEILKIVGDETQTIKTSDFKVSVSAGMQTKVVDNEEIDLIVNAYGLNTLPIKRTYSLDRKKLEYLKQINPALSVQILNACESKPKKTSLKIEELA